jgi:C4-dicarboxylate-specific signal transduction histidine kinase
MLNEVSSLEQGVGHIKEIVSIQQSYATMRGLVEEIEVSEVVEHALQISYGAFLRHGVTIRRDFKPTPKIIGERGKILQILHNLLRNAKHAVDEASTIEKTIEVRIEAGSSGMVRVIVNDNGVGIEPQNITRIFAQGFTTRKGGHGFGLHSSANAAKEMRGSLTAQSDGLGTGATFILELPLAEASSHTASAGAQAHTPPEHFTAAAG